MPDTSAWTILTISGSCRSSDSVARMGGRQKASIRKGPLFERMEAEVGGLMVEGKPWNQFESPFAEGLGVSPKPNLFPPPCQACPEPDEGKGDRGMVESVIKHSQFGSVDIIRNGVPSFQSFPQGRGGEGFEITSGAVDMEMT